MSRSSRRRNAIARQKQKTATQQLNRRANVAKPRQPTPKTDPEHSYFGTLPLVLATLYSIIPGLRGDRLTNTVVFLCAAMWTVYYYRTRIRRLLRSWRRYIPRKLLRPAPVVVILLLIVVVPLFVASSMHHSPPSRESANRPLTIAIANFESPEQKSYGLTDQLIRALRTATARYHDVSILPLNRSITEESGGGIYARKIGMRVHANIVLWGYYTATSTNASVSSYLELLRGPNTLSLSSTSQTLYRPIGDLDRFRVQFDLSTGASFLVLVVLAVARYNLGDYQSAQTRFQQALSYRESTVHFIRESVVRLYLGNCYLIGHNLAAAARQYMRAINLDSHLTYAYGNLGEILEVEGNQEAAAQEYDKAVRSSPNDPITYYMRASYRYRIRRLHAALADMNRVVQLAPQHPEGFVNRGIAEDELGHRNLAEKDYLHALKLDSRFANAYENLGSLNLQEHKWSSALQYLNLAIALDDTTPIAFENRAAVERVLNQTQQSQRDLVQARYLEQHPTPFGE